MLSAKRHRGRRPLKLELQTRASNPAGSKHGADVAVAPGAARAGHSPADKTITGHPLGVKAGSPSPPPGTAERNERLLQMCLEAAAKAISAGDAVKGRSGWPRSPRSSGLPGDNGLPMVLPGAVHPKALVDTITALAFAVDAKGPYAPGHSQAVARLAARIALQAGLSPSEVEETRLAGLLHDIGKIHVPESVCNKPDRLTAEEFEVMRSHSAWGAKMLEPLNVKTIERIVRHHHERFDGKGYPDGLAAEKIPLGARIVAVAESFHSMLSDLPYKSPRTFEDALAELRRGSGQQFDPRIVMAFLDWIKAYVAGAK